LTADGPDLGERHSTVTGSSDLPPSLSSSELSPASAQNLDPPPAQRSGSGDLGEEGSPSRAAATGFVASESPSRGRELFPTVIFESSFTYVPLIDLLLIKYRSRDFAISTITYYYHTLMSAN
jgi:hypothetical protein